MCAYRSAIVDQIDLVEQVRALAPDGVAALIDHVHDAASLTPFAALVRPGGRVVSPVAMGAQQALAHLPVSVHVVQAAVDRAGELAGLAVDGEPSLPVETLPLADAGKALARRSTRRVRGKLVLLVG